MTQLAQEFIARHWQATVFILVLTSLLADILAEKHWVYLALVAGIITACGWVMLLGTHAPFERSIAFNSVLAYVATAVVALALFHEKLTTSQWAGIGLGVIAIVLLS